MGLVFLLTNLGADTDAVADLNTLNVLSDLGSSADDFVTRNAEVMAQGTPATRDGVNIGSTDTTVSDGNVDIVVSFLLEVEVVDLEVGPVLGVSDTVSARHDEIMFTWGKKGKDDDVVMVIVMVAKKEGDERRCLYGDRGADRPIRSEASGADCCTEDFDWNGYGS